MSPSQALSHSSASGSLTCPTHRLLWPLQPPASIPICPFNVDDWMAINGCFDGIDSGKGWRWWWGCVGIFFVPFVQILC
ncbi:hypothetical protein ACB092_10G030500 [Castanea dentata]